MAEQEEPDWLLEVLEEVHLRQFYSKLTKDLQLTKLSHFDFVSEEDLVQLGLSKPAARRLLAAIRKRKSFVTALKNRLVNKLAPLAVGSHSSYKNKHEMNHDFKPVTTPSLTSYNASHEHPNSDISRLTCLINSQDLIIKEEIGHGVHGFVKKGEWTTPNGRVVEVALKILRKGVMDEPGASFNEFVKEISVMHQLNHPNIIKLYGIVLSSPMMMVTELAPFGNLRDKLRNENGSTPISQLINFGLQISFGMAYLESRRFVHRDLAARNIFISHGKKILIGDLGLMRTIPGDEDHYVMSERTKIPYPWCAPESLRHKQFSSSSDVYMFGVTLWEMFSFGQEPWSDLTLNEILQNISSQKIRLPCPEACPTMVYQTLLQCWDTNPACRPNFSTLYQYLSTSYPLEVRSTQQISKVGQRRVEGKLSDNQGGDVVSNYSSLMDADLAGLSENTSERRVLECAVDDRILVIDGQPEKYWWKGQNQRTFKIGWFPLSYTRWLVPKKSPNYVSKPLKNSFVHTGHCGPDGKWGNPRFIDPLYLRNSLEPEDFASLSAHIEKRKELSKNLLPKSIKAKSRLSRLFGINDSSPLATHLLNNAYRKFSNDTSKNCTTKSKLVTDVANFRSQPKGFTPPHLDTKSTLHDDEPPLIDFSEEIEPMTNTGPGVVHLSDAALSNSTADKVLNHDSLIDMDDSTIMFQELSRHASETQLNRLADGLSNCRQSWAGSWNTGTFISSNANIYSAYYCPQDVATSNIGLTTNDLTTAATDFDQNPCYYSSVPQDEPKFAIG